MRMEWISESNIISFYYVILCNSSQKVKKYVINMAETIKKELNINTVCL